MLFYIRSLKQALNHGLVLKKVHRVIKFNQKRLVKAMYWFEYQDKKKSKKWLWKIFFQAHE